MDDGTYGNRYDYIGASPRPREKVKLPPNTRQFECGEFSSTALRRPEFWGQAALLDELLEAIAAAGPGGISHHGLEVLMSEKCIDSEWLQELIANGRVVRSSSDGRVRLVESTWELDWGEEAG